MCGIVGVVNFDGIRFNIWQDRLDCALAKLARRGPDGSNIWHNKYCAFGHTRLAVIDLSIAASQPMVGFGSSITFNGEIYNFPFLKSELENLGYQFRTKSDTEVLLAGWREWRDQLFAKIQGMFAFGLYDTVTQEFVLARDAFGKKPILYTSVNNHLIFSSTLSGVECLLGEKNNIDPISLGLYFSLRYIPEPRSIVTNVSKIPSGHWANLKLNGELSVQRWYNPPVYLGQIEDGFEASALLLRESFDRAVGDRLIADVPVGVFLSGGVDSSIVASSAIRHQPGIKSFTIGFDDDAKIYDESLRAKKVAEHLGTDHHEIRISGSDIDNSFDEFIDGLDEPFADPSALPTFVLCRGVREHVTVALSGDGADELFGGYRKYVAENYAGLYRHLPSFVKAILRQVVLYLPESKTHRILEKIRQIRRFVLHADKPQWERFAAWIELLSQPELEDFFWNVPVGIPTVASLLEQTGEHISYETDTIVNLLSQSDVNFSLSNQMLVKVDGMSMANGLEVRSPFLDLRVAQFAQTIPGSWKVKGSERKRILKAAFSSRLPKSVFQGGKRGFDPPLEAWFKGEFADRLAFAIDSERVRTQGLFNPNLPTRWFTDLLNGRRDTAARLWTFLVFQYWYERRLSS